MKSKRNSRVPARPTLLPLALALSACASAWAQDAVRPTGTLAEVTVIATTPVAGTGIAVGKFAGNVQTLSHDALDTPTQDLSQRLSQSLGSMNVNDTQGNPHNVDLNYRGFTASPALGTPQGLSVFLDGIRINEPFGDVVSWDLLPQLVVDKVTVIPGSNPVYGLNTLGGAISMTSKNGNSVNGSQGGISIGSFGRRTVDVEHGSHNDDGNLYFAASVANDDGWAINNPSKVRQFFGKYTLYGERGDFAVSLLAADNLLYGNQSVPLSMLDESQQGYSHPDYTATQNITLNLQGNWAVDESNSYAGNLYARNLTRDILNSNVNALVSASTNDPGCVAIADCPATNLLAHYTQSSLGANAQWTNTDPLWNMNQVFTIGLNAEFSHTGFNNQGQYATVDASRGLVGVSDYQPQADVQSDNQRLGLFATSTFDASDALSITASARYDYATLKLSGLSCVDQNGLCDSTSSIALGTLTDVSGDHVYQRLNPSLGLTYLLAPNWIAFASYAEGFRTPSAIELACSDPAVPCSGVPNAFGADPELSPVVSRTYEIGLRGNLGNRLKWRAAYYRTTLDNDILFNQSSLNSGYFSNVGQTLRQGMELGLDGRLGSVDYAIDMDWIEATYRSGFSIANQANSSYAASVPVKAGDFIPGIPQWVFKGRVSYALDGKTRIGFALQAQGPTFARGDENNADINGQVPGFTTLKLDISHSVDKTFNLYAGVNNVLDAKYAGYGALATNNITSGANEQFRSMGAPRTLYAGIQAKF